MPLAAQADGLLRALAKATGSEAIAALDGATILGERAAINGWRIGGDVSPGGGCRLYQAADDHVALNLARDDDRALLPAFFEQDFDASSDAAIAALIASSNAAELVSRARMLGLATARENETDLPLDAPGRLIAGGSKAPPPMKLAPVVVDFSALWAGPLASHLMQLAGGEVIKVESTRRLDGMRDGDRDFFALLNQGKASVALDFTSSADRAALRSLIKRADIVIEASRPRALRNLGLDADAIVRAQPGLVWLTITAHGATGEQADWVGFGDDCGVAVGLSAASRKASGVSGFVGDAIADPLTGLNAALVGWNAWRSGAGGRYDVSLRACAQAAFAAARADDPAALDQSLKAWSAARGAPFPDVPRRPVVAPIASPGADNARLLSEC
jgi:hypothetical protein